MKWKDLIAPVLAASLLASALYAATPHPAAQAFPSYRPHDDATGGLFVPQEYREWVFLSSGFDMRYAKGTPPPTDHLFDNVFVPRATYRAFKATGTWPDHTILILENRTGANKGSINQAGHFQAGRTGLEAHVKDVARFKGGWAFFAFDGDASSRRIDYKADCYSCHQVNAAVDTTFVQFYPTLLPVATRRGTLSRSYVAHEAAAGTSER